MGIEIELKLTFKDGTTKTFGFYEYDDYEFVEHESGLGTAIIVNDDNSEYYGNVEKFEVISNG